MGRTTKFYHRGNNDVREANTLTAVFKVTLAVDASGCKTTQSKTSFFIPDFGGGNSYLAFIPEELALDEDSGAKQRRGGKGAKGQTTCTGDVTVTVEVEISSPNGRGNGEAQAGPIAAQFGLEHNGAFNRFAGGALAPGSEHWRVTGSVQVGTIRCAGGVLRGSVKINNGLGAPTAFEITYDVSVVSCGTIRRENFDVRLVTPPRGIGAGGRVRNVFRQVTPAKDAPPRRRGDAPPYPPKNPPAGTAEVGPDGQVRTRPP